MAEADTSIYGTLGQNLPKFNALDAVSTFAAAQNALNQNKLFQQENTARKALGEVMQQAITPDGKSIDYDKAAILMSADPRTAFKAPEIIKQWIDQKKVQAETVNQNLDAHAKMQKAYLDKASSYLPYGNNVKRGQVIKGIGELVGQGMLDKDTAINIAATLPEDGQALYQHLRGLALQSEGSAKAIESVYGSLNSQEMGGYTQQQFVSPFMRTITPVQTLEKTPTPAELNEPKTRINPITQKEEMVPRVEQGPMYGGLGSRVNPILQGRDGSNLPAGAQGQGAPSGVGAPPASGSGNALMPQPFQSAPYEHAVTGFSPQDKAYKEKAGGDVAEMEKNLNTYVEQGTGIIMNMQLANDALKHFNPGGGAKSYQELARIMQAAGLPQETVDKVAGGDRASAQIFQKAMMGIVLPQLKQVMGGLGQMNLAEFSSVLEANPNIETDPRAIPVLLDYVKRHIELSQAKQQGFNVWKQNGHDVTQFEAAWNRKLQKEGISTLTPDLQKRFKSLKESE